MRPRQDVKLKLAAFQFQKYGLLRGRVLHVNADSTEAPSSNTRSDALAGRDRPMGPLAFRALVELSSQELEVGQRCQNPRIANTKLLITKATSNHRFQPPKTTTAVANKAIRGADRHNLHKPSTPRRNAPSIK